MAEDEKPGGESTLTVRVALGANAGIGVLKLVAGFLTGSTAMLADAALSAAERERSCADIDADLRARFADLQIVFLEPVVRSDR